MTQFFKQQRVAIICLGLILATAALYWPVTRHDFINIDDQRFITQNPHTLPGLTGSGIRWAFQTFETENWHPLTWISHMLDCELFGQNAGGHHLSSLLLHALNTALVFLLLEQLTGAIWRSAFVAALFAWHLLHVESVAWVCERKDVLCAFFWLLSLMAYAQYAKKSSKGSYALSLLLFAAALMSKPMAVTLPFVLLLLDFWPLQRFQNSPASNRLRAGGALVFEKIPFFALTAASSIVTVFAQKAGGELIPFSGLPLPTRLASALLGYVTYLSKTFWPVDLAVFYPYLPSFPPLQILGAALLLAALTILFTLAARQQAWLVIGWLWFLGTLVPVIGLMQAGLQAVADRYMYLPSLGLFIGVVWGLNSFFSRWSGGWKFSSFIGGAALAGCLAATTVQLTYWQNSVTLALHTLKATKNNYVVLDSLSRALSELGQPERAVPFFVKAVKIQPDWPQAQFSLGTALGEIGRTDEAIEHLRAGVILVPSFAAGHFTLGQTLNRFGKPDEAIEQFTEVLRLNPDHAGAQLGWGVALAAKNKIAEAIPHFSEAVRLKPDDPEMRFYLGLALLDDHQPAAAAAQFSEELRFTPNETKAHYRFAQSLQQQNKLAEAMVHYHAALRLTPNFPEAAAALDQIFRAHPEFKAGEPLDIER